jgi:hypothetical protein
MYSATIVSSLFNGAEDRDKSARVIAHIMRCLVSMNIDLLIDNPWIPPLYQSPVRYWRDSARHGSPDEKDDPWQDILDCIRTGTADCEDLCAWRIAELIVREGVNAFPVITITPISPTRQLVHVQVGYEDGSIEDPSRVKGMI